jgi:L-fuconolactonase
VRCSRRIWRQAPRAFAASVRSPPGTPIASCGIAIRSRPDCCWTQTFAAVSPVSPDTALSYEAWLYHHQLPDLLDLARSFPDTTIILNHIGGPLGVGAFATLREGVFNYWKHYISRLAECPNVVVKLGGLGMPIGGFDWHTRPAPPSSGELAETMRPYFLWCLETFGTERCMFESNFPVDKESCSYVTIWNAFKRIVEGFSADEKARLFHDNAVRTYRLD